MTTMKMKTTAKTTIKKKSLKTKQRDSSLPAKRVAQSDMKKTETRVEIKPAKGRPMLTWVGKKPLRYATAYPAQLVETFNAHVRASHDSPLQKTWTDWPKDIPQTGLLFHGDNKDVLAYLLANGFRGKVKLIYIDPPFDSGADYVRKVNLRGGASKANFDSEGYALGEQVQYTDIWTNDNYLQFIYERLLLAKELLTEDGSIWLHCDPNRSHYLKVLIDELFGSDQFVNEIIWKRSGSKGLTSSQFPDAHDAILYYSKDRNVHQWQRVRGTYTEEHLEKFRYVEEGTERKYMMDNLQNPNPNRPNLTYDWNGHVRCWRWTRERMREMHDAGKIAYSQNGMPYFKRYLDKLEGPTLTDTWDDISPINSQAIEREGYPTQKPEEVIARVLAAASIQGDVVLDFFLGSGTTAAVAQKLGRRWIGADINKGAIQTTTKRLQGVIQEQVENAKSKTPALPGMEDEETPAPAQLSFSVYRVNDYDLQIQHNETFNLAVEHLGMTRTKTDAFFDGTLGKKLVKIVPFNHPVTPLDLEEVKKELNNRPDEERDIVMVGLGKEVAVAAWLDEWNKLRKQGNIPNKIEVIELRSDPKYGGFFTHESAKAKISFKRGKDNVEITIDDFISPTILERLKQQNKDNPLFQPQINDWRSMVDSVMIDSSYDGKVFNITQADVPEKKNDLVEGKYEVEAKKGATVAVKVTDMLGEEVLVTKQI